MGRWLFVGCAISLSPIVPIRISKEEYFCPMEFRGNLGVEVISQFSHINLMIE